MFGILCVGKGGGKSIVTVTGIHFMHVVFDEKSPIQAEQCLRLVLPSFSPLDNPDTPFKSRRETKRRRAAGVN